MKKAIAIFILFFIAILLSSPGIIYLIGIHNIIGKPKPIDNLELNPKQISILLHYYNYQTIPKIEKLNPWKYTLIIINNEQQSLPEGTKLAWSIAKDYTSTNLKTNSNTYWHLSGTALTIWLTNNWTEKQIITKAFTVISQELSLKNDKG